ncbi:MAG: c-type cytochrome biogenesis protein CcsB [Candidatus Cloacimonadota bacterium]|nr:MAG: c-type cytochrome biogenesis protein CcsB [Candidatus Cloacimonadota bacterium]
MNLLNLELNLFLVVVALYSISFIFYLVYLVFPQFLGRGRIASSVLTLGVIVHIMLIIIRIIQTRHPPFQTLYEALSWFSFSVVIAYLFVEWKRKVRLAGIFVTAIVIAASLYAILGLSSVPRPLPPALQSKWFAWHVIAAFSAYAAFVVAFCIEIAFLLFGSRARRYELTESAKKLFHRTSYNLILLGFPLLGYGIISGGAWAEEAWGVYWSWDPKETWSLITWLVYALYLHAKITPRWTTWKASVLVILGFICMIFTFLGVNWITQLLNIPSLHAF